MCSKPECIEYRKVDSVLPSVEEEELGWAHCTAFLWKINRIQDVHHNNSNNLEATFEKLSEKSHYFIMEFIDVLLWNLLMILLLSPPSYILYTLFKTVLCLYKVLLNNRIINLILQNTHENTIRIINTMRIFSSFSRNNIVFSNINTMDYIPTNHIWSYKYQIYMGSPCKPYGDPTLITHRDLQNVYTLNKYHFSLCIYYKETIKILVTHIN